MKPDIKLTDETRRIIKDYLESDKKYKRAKNFLPIEITPKIVHEKKPQSDLVQISKYILKLESLSENLQNHNKITGSPMRINEKFNDRLKSASKCIITAVELLKTIK